MSAGNARGRVSGPFWPQPASPNVSASNAISPWPFQDIDALHVARAATLVLHCNMPSILPAMNAPFEPTPLTDAEYHARTSTVLARIEATIDQWLQDDVVDIDTQRTGGLLELGFGNGSKIVINTQPPLHELWLAARSGGYHYKHANGRWLDTRDGCDFFERLSACASEQAGRSLKFEPPLSA
jgi:CyaY protein